MIAFKDYRTAYEYACDRANEIKIPHGIGYCKLAKEWTVRLLPSNPDGTESKLEKVLPGYPKFKENQ